MTILTSIHGRKLGLTAQGNLEAHGKQVTCPCVDATVTVADEDTNVRDITIQLKDANGDDLTYTEVVEILIINSATGLTLAAPSPTTGLEAGTDGALMQVVQHNLYLATCETDGDIDLTWTDTGTAAAYIAVRLPSGDLVWGSQALTNA